MKTLQASIQIHMNVGTRVIDKYGQLMNFCCSLQLIVPPFRVRIQLLFSVCCLNDLNYTTHCAQAPIPRPRITPNG